MDDKKCNNIIFYLIITILAVGISIIFAPRIIDSLSSFIYKKQKPKVNLKFDKNYGPRIVRKKNGRHTW